VWAQLERCRREDLAVGGEGRRDRGVRSGGDDQHLLAASEMAYEMHEPLARRVETRRAVVLARLHRAREIHHHDEARAG